MNKIAGVKGKLLSSYTWENLINPQLIFQVECQDNNGDWLNEKLLFWKSEESNSYSMSLNNKKNSTSWLCSIFFSVDLEGTLRTCAKPYWK